MVLLDQVARSSTIAILAILAVVLLRDGRRLRFAAAAVVFFVTITAHLVLTSPDYAGLRGVDTLLVAAAFAVPASFLLFSRALFEEEPDAVWWDLGLLVALVATGFLRTTTLSVVGTVLFYTGSLAVVMAALARVVRGRSADLVEPRRRLRLFLTVAVGVIILMVIAGEILLAGGRPPRWVDALKSTGALGLAFLFANWLLTLRPEVFPIEPVADSALDSAARATGAGEDVRFRDRLLALMREQHAYRQEGLTIAVLSRQLDMPEYRLRRVINQQLGYRNFNAFLNDFRIDEACRVLADPAQERLPILNLALDLGYGSPGAFNRAFRAKTGQTPTEFRRSRLAES